MANGMKASSVVWIILAAFILSGLTFMVATDRFAAIGGSSGDGDTSITIEGATNCEYSPSLMIRGYDIENKGTAITENFAYRVDGSTVWTAGTLGTSVTGVELGKTYDIVAGIDVSDGIDNPYGEEFQVNITCLPTVSKDVGLYNDEVEASVTAVFYNEDNDASAETVGLEKTIEVIAQFETGNDEAFGNAFLKNPNVLVVGYNASEWDKIVSVKLEGSGVDLVEVTVPKRMRSESLKDASFDYVAFAAPAITDEKSRFVIEMKSDDSTAVVTDGIVYLFAGTQFIQDNGEIGVGVEDEDGADIGTSDPDSLALDFTA